MHTFQKIARPERGTRWVIPDIHGCARTFEYLVKEVIRLKSEDHLYLLGDFVDRGPRSAEVIDFIISLKSRGYQVFALRGNHDHDLLENWIYYKEVKSISHYEGFLNLMESNRTLDLVDDFGRMKPQYELFLRELPYYYELPDYYLVHAGFNFNSAKPFEDLESMIWSRHLLRRKRPIDGIGNRQIVIGHSIEKLSYIQKRIREKNQIIALDNGCFYALPEYGKEYQNNDIGFLCAFNLDSQELRLQPNMD